jgi:hypothetical protein
MNLYGNHGKIKICNMKVNVCFYTDENFRIRENILIDDLKSKGFDKIYNYRAEDVKQGDFYLENKELLDLEKGDGYWVWKPKIILDTFNNMEFGDVLLYIDAGDKLNGDIVNSLRDFFKTEDYYFTNWNGVRIKQKHATKRDCFVLMGCDEEKYHDVAQVEAGIIGVKKTKEMITFFEEYLFFCRNKQIVSDDENIHGENFPGWQFHRWDQSILTNLIVKNNLKFSNSFINNITHNFFLP